MRALAIDPGEKNAAVAVLDSINGIPIVVWAKTIKFPGRATDSPSWEKAAFHSQQFLPILDAAQPNVVVLEYPALNGHRLFDIGALHYAYLQICLERHLDFIHLPSTTWKYLFCGNGHTPPVRYRDIVNSRFCFEKPLRNFDVAAAFAMGYVGLRFWLWYSGYVTDLDLSKPELRIFKTRIKPFISRGGFLWRFYNEQSSSCNVR